MSEQQKVIKKVWIEPGCISCGSCEFICNEVFKVDPTSKVKPNIDFEKYKELIKKAALKCPVQVIKIEE